MNYIETLTNWQINNPTFGLLLPNGWFGRPYDNCHEITWIEERKYRFLIEIDEQLLFIITKSNQFEIITNNNDLIIRNFYRLTFDRLGYGDLTAHTEIFDKGELTLIAYR